ncbi:hypothetical protein AN958_08202 [Leucoagaricus sp. SymC.cos]|nr:hypothetical protein AN958_08202 [Leucoagaricus sp. SymC.cos]
MSLIKPSSPQLQVQVVVTTTVFSSANPTGSIRNDSGHSHTSVLVGAIVGGVIAGTVLALLVTLGWIWWGKEIKRTKRKQQREMVCFAQGGVISLLIMLRQDEHRTTRYNTLQNARISGPKHHSYRPLLKQQQDDKRVKFAGDEKAPAALPPAENIDPERAKHMLFDNPNTPPPGPLWTTESRLRRTGSFTWPLPLNPLKKLSQSSMRSTDNNNPGTGGSPAHPEPNPASRDDERSLPHKPSNVSTHSNASGQGRVPASLLAALGNVNNRNSLHAGDRQSTSSLWSYLLRLMPGTRSSQQSAGENAYQPSERDQAFPIGTAV